MPNQRMTLEDISAKIGISRTTIYKVINKKDERVSASTRVKVNDALEQYHYIPNKSARDLALNKTYRIAVIDYISPIAPYFSRTIKAGCDNAINKFADNGLAISIYTSPFNCPEQQISDIMHAYSEGIRDFIIAAERPDLVLPIINQLKKEACSIVLLNKPIPGAEYDAFIGADDYRIGALASGVLCRMLPDNGNILVLTAGETWTNKTAMKARLDGFVNECSQNHRGITLLPIAKEASSKEHIDALLDDSYKSSTVNGIFDLSYKPEFICDYLTRNPHPETRLVCTDLFDELIPYIRNEIADTVIFQDIQRQALLACSLLFSKMCYGTVITKKDHYSKLEVIVSENLDYFI